MSATKADCRREISKVALDEDILNSARQEMIPEQETETGTDRQVFEPSRSDQPSSADNGSAIKARCINQNRSSLKCQSRIPELCGDENFESEEPPPQEMNELSTSMNVMPMSILLQRRNSPELLHPINCESYRDSLWQIRRGMPAANDRWCSYWSPNDSCHSVPGDGDNILTSTASNDQHHSTETHVYPMSHETPLDDAVLTMSNPPTEVVIPSSPNQLFASLPSYMVPPISSLAEYVHPALATFSSCTMDHNDPSLRTAVQQDENAGGCPSPTSTPSQSIPEEPSSTLSLSDSPDSIFNLYCRSSTATSLRRLELDRQKLRHSFPLSITDVRSKTWKCHPSPLGLTM